MTRKDYILIAKAIKDAATGYPEARPDAVQQSEDIAFGIAEALAGDNSRFDRDRFLRACGVIE